MTTFNVISADVITKKGVEHFVGLTVNVNGKQEKIARTCKQALLDLHKSARGSDLPSEMFDNGVKGANPILYRKFSDTIISLVGKVGMADVEFYEAGSEYVATEDSSAVKAELAKVGDILKTTKAGSRIEGFMSFPLDAMELARKEAIASINPMLLMQGLFGITMPTSMALPSTPQGLPAKTTAEHLFDREEEELNAEAFGEFPADDAEEPADDAEEPAVESTTTSTTKAKTTK